MLVRSWQLTSCVSVCVYLCVCVCALQVVAGTDSSVELNYLNSLTEYQVAVFAVYQSSASEALRGSATTCRSLQLHPLPV